MRPSSREILLVYDDDIEDALETLRRTDVRLRCAWEDRISDPDGFRSELDEYNAAGRRVAELMSQRLEAGDEEIPT